MENGKITFDLIRQAVDYIRNPPQRESNEVLLDVNIEKALAYMDDHLYSVCRVTHKDGMLFGVFEGGMKITTGAAGMLNIFDMMPISGWTVYYNGIKLHEEGKEEFYLFLKDYVKES